MKVRIISGGLAEFIGPGVNHGVAVEEIHGGHEAVLEFLLDETRMWRRTERASLEKKPSTRLSHDPCLGVKVNLKRPAS